MREYIKMLNKLERKTGIKTYNPELYLEYKYYLSEALKLNDTKNFVIVLYYIYLIMSRNSVVQKTSDYCEWKIKNSGYRLSIHEVLKQSTYNEIKKYAKKFYKYTCENELYNPVSNIVKEIECDYYIGLLE